MSNFIIFESAFTQKWHSGHYLGDVLSSIKIPGGSDSSIMRDHLIRINANLLSRQGRQKIAFTSRMLPLSL